MVFEIGNAAVVLDRQLLVAERRVANLNCDRFLGRGLLRLELLLGVVCIIGYRVVDQADRHAIVEPSLIDQQRQRVVRHLEISRHDQGVGRFVILLARRANAVPYMSGAGGARLPELLAPVLDLMSGHWRLVGRSPLDASPAELILHNFFDRP